MSSCIQYRLGPFGFLPLQENTKNLGIEDLMVAVEYVFENAERLGGNREKITLLGQGAGSLAIDIILKSRARKFLANAVSIFDLERFMLENFIDDPKIIDEDEIQQSWFEKF